MENVAIAIWIEAYYQQTESYEYFDREDWIGLFHTPTKFYDMEGNELPHL